MLRKLFHETDRLLPSTLAVIRCTVCFVDILLALCCLFLLFPQVLHEPIFAYACADAVFALAMRILVLGSIFAFAFDVSARRA